MALNYRILSPKTSNGSLFNFLKTTKACWLIIFFLAKTVLLQSQTIWLEDFSGANQGWTQNFTDCDGTPASFAGVANSRFEVTDMEGAPCCSAGGGNDNEWITNPIDVSTACNITVSLDYGTIGTFECEPGGPYFGCTGNVAIDNGHDQILVDYSVDGGPWINFHYVCGGGSGSFFQFFPGPISTIAIRIRPANKSTGETYWFDNIKVEGAQQPIMDVPSDISVCPNQMVAIPFTGTSGATYSWVNDNTSIGLGASGNGDISFTSANILNQETGTITVTPTLAGCIGDPVTFNITVNPGPQLQNPGPQMFCGGDDVDIPLNGGNGSAIFNWTNSNPTIGLASSGSGDIMFTAANVASTTVGNISITPSENGCTGPSQNFTITIRPLPVVNQPPNQEKCAGANVSVSFSGTPGATYNWTNDNTAIGLGASGTGNFGFVGANVSMQEVANITVVPSLNGCDGAPVTFTLTINPIAIIDDPGDFVFCADELVLIPLSGQNVSVFSWTNSDTNIGLQANGTGDIDFTTNNVSTTTTGIINVSAAGAACPGPSQTFTITVTPLPVANAPMSVNTCGGQILNIPITGTAGATFQWTNSNPAIGLAANGSGDIVFTTSAVASNTTGAITITPVIGNCFGAPQSFTITVSPGPSVNNPGNQVLCAGDVLLLPLTGTAGATFSWTNSNPAIGLAATGTGDINFTAAALSSVQTGTIIVSPSQGGCTGPSISFTIMVNPGSTPDNPGNTSACTGSAVLIPLTGTAGAAFSWTNSNPGIGLPASGTGDISFTASALTGSGLITVTSALGSCPGQSVMFTIDIVGAPSISPIPDTSFCGGSSIFLGFNGSPGATFSWDNSNTNIGLPANGSGPLNFTAPNPVMAQIATIIVTPHLNSCNGVAESFFIHIEPQAQAAITAGANTICAGDSVNLTASGGSDFLWSTGSNSPAITVFPDTTTTYTISVSYSGACADTAAIQIQVNQPNFTSVQLSSCMPADTGTVVQYLTNALGCDSIVTTITTLLPADTTYLTASNCDQAFVGVFTAQLTNQNGCDSIVITTVNLLPSDTTYLNLSSCDPAAAGTFTQLLSNQFGCDSTVLTTIVYNPGAIDTTYLAATTCDPAQTGNVQVLYNGADGCDSLVITITSLLPKDTTLLSATTCDVAAAGTFSQLLSNQFGCDSLIVTNISFDPALLDTTYLAATSCDPAQAGISQLLYNGFDGCDSLVITTTTLLPKDTTQLAGTTCDPAAAGVFTQLLSNQFGCDSLIVTNISFDPALLDTTYLTATSCDPAQTGISQLLFNGFDGCDSLVITTTTLLPKDTTQLTAITCDPAAAGVFTQLFSNQYGCDSLIITSIAFDPTLLDTTYLAAASCDPTQTGISQLLYNGFDGCDSLVITTTALLPSDTLFFSTTTCDPASAGTFTQVFSNAYGCDSVIITQVQYNPILCLLAVNATVQGVSCAGLQNGSVNFQFFNGTPPVNYFWTSPGAGTGSGVLNLNGMSATLGNLAAGNYTFNLIDANGLAATGIVVQVLSPNPISLNITTPNLNGFALACAGDTDGSANTTAFGGTQPFMFSWSTGASTPELQGLSAGIYTLTITDANACTESASVLLSAPPALSLQISMARPDCGDTLADLLITPLGGIGPFQTTVDGNLAPNGMPSVGSGQHLIGLQDANGCILDSSYQIVLPPVPMVNLPQDTTVQLGQSLSLQGIANISAWDTLFWNPLPDANCPNCLLQQWTPEESMHYTLTLIDTFGCEATAQILVLVEKKILLYIPTAFKPTDNAVDPVFHLGAGPGIGDLEFIRIYDRWGELVYQWEDAVPVAQWPGWDGTQRGEQLNPGVYVYHLRVKLEDGSSVDRTGDVSIIR